MSESVILCEGFHDRAFWDGWLRSLGCDSNGFKPGTPGYPAPDPWGAQVRGGQFAFRSKSGKFVRLRSCNGKGNILSEARIRLNGRSTKQLLRLVINVDTDTTATGMSVASTGFQQIDVLSQAQQIDKQAFINSDGEIEMDGGATKIALVRWEVSDPPAQGLPDQQTLERLVSSAIVAAYPDRAASVHNWLNSRLHPPATDPKEHAWSYMAGWYASFGCEAFYSNLWNDAQVVAELQTRLTQSGAWRIAEALAN